MTYEEAAATIRPGRYRHFKGNEYEVMVVYRALYGDRGVWCRPAEMWSERVTRDGKTYTRFEKIGEGTDNEPD